MPGQTGQSSGSVDLGRTPRELVSMGLHVIRVTTAELRTSQKGNPTVNFRCQILGEKDPDKGKSLFMNFTMVPQSRWVFEKFLDAVKAPSSGKVDIQQFVGCRLRVQVTHEDREMSDGTSKTQERIIDWIPLPDVKEFEGGKVQAEDAEEIRKGSERLDALVNPGALAQQSSFDGGMPSGDDESPF